MDEALAARRLSAALGSKVTADDIESVVETDRNTYITVKTDRLPWLAEKRPASSSLPDLPFRSLALYAGNMAYLGDGEYMKNGQKVDEDWLTKHEPRYLSK